ncbi:ABC transporter permease [Saccharibacillus endophyticus]|uniref:ABC transporter permease n=1 Tax=Saccharibacillus endophyticus TaxID=2060666 RepID=A0ABQ2A6Y4_9BACL|nr:ABC transporter permease [Saccharibacillus endophyticus]GGH86559.1 ABC transporter permease [Saccharibacillus endophyticus]
MSLLVNENIEGVRFARVLEAEWRRLWKRRPVRLMALTAPAASLVSAKYLLSQNALLDPALPEYATAGNVPVLALAEMLVTAFSGMMLVLAGLTVTEEYRGGQLRMGMLRAVSLTRIMAAKWLACLSFVLIQLALYFLSSVVIGRFGFPNPASYPLFYEAGTVSYAQGIFYDLAYYGLAALALAVLLTVFFWIATIGRSSTAALGTGIGFLLLSYAAPTLLNYFRPLLDAGVYMRMYFLSLLMIEWEGLAATLANLHGLAVWNFGVLAGYAILFGGMTAWAWKRRDSFE